MCGSIGSYAYRDNIGLHMMDEDEVQNRRRQDPKLDLIIKTQREHIETYHEISPERAAELVAEDVRLAARSLGRITGRVDVEEVLDVIFREFCIGK